MDIYSTTALNRLVDALDRLETPFLSTFFPVIETSDTEDIKFDVTNNKRRLAPFVSPLKEGKVVESLGYVTKSFSPAYVKDKRVHDPNKALKRMAGETIGGSMAPINRHQANIARDTADQVEMLIRRKEVMACEVLRTGKCVISGEDHPAVEVDFGRDASLTVTLAGAARWGQAGVKPLEDLEDWTARVLNKCGAQARDVIMDLKAWRLFRADADVQKFLDTRPLSSSNDALQLLRFAQQGLSYQGAIGSLRFWVHSDYYVNDAGTETAFLPDYTVLIVAPVLDGVQHHGAIRDEAAGIQAREFFTKSWVVEDPSRRLLLMQSAPLVVPYRPNASFCATVNS